MSDHETGQPEMLPGLRATVAEARARGRAERRRRDDEAAPAEVDPVAQVLVDVPLAHLDRPFDYSVPAAMAATAVPGARVKVRFAGQDVDGFVVARVPTSQHPGRLAPLRRVVSPEPVLTPAVAELTARLAHRYAGARADVLRLAVPPRHAATEKAPEPERLPVRPADLGEARLAWAEQGAEPGAGEAFLRALTQGRPARAVWQPAAGTDWPRLVAEAALATVSGGRGVLICVPDHRDVARVSEQLTAVLGEDQHAVLTAEGGPARRYAAFLAVARGRHRVVVGTRSAAFAPVQDLGLVVIWDDGDDLYAEPRAPYPHTREVLLTRAELEGTAALVGGFARTCEAEYLLRTGWARALAPDRRSIRAAARVDVTPAEDRGIPARIPGAARAMLRRALESGPVLVQVPRAGWAPSLACERCRTPARCRGCQGPLELTASTEPPRCRWCGTPDPRWACPECGSAGLRAPVVGRDRTAEELGRSLPGATIRSSGGDRVLQQVGTRPEVVVATPGAEPVAEGGYAGVLLLDTWMALGRAELRTEEEALRRFMTAAGLVRPGGHVVAVGDPAHPVLQALVRWDPAGFAARELEARASAHLPPAVRLATVTGEPGAVDDALTLLALPEVAEVLGPVPVAAKERTPGAGGPGGRPAEPEEIRLVLRVPRSSGTALSESLGELQRIRSARKLQAVRVQVDPLEL
ncbi:primosomal protein N' [Nocardioides campestrisoli]|uniref:primosomal protein N' n=1 Tax=Nocardioides campestrisoli TaxID=2736757 RepID=UPI00163D46B7|nr:primosomal protein N' [Nocardioides campestrisoli]